MEISWQLAGLTAEGRGLTRPVRTSNWRVPAAVDLDGNRLRWNYCDGDRLGEVIGVRDRLIDDFVKLADKSPEDIRDFARRWGVLMICEHGRPGGHAWPGVPEEDMLNGREPLKPCAPRGWPDECWEPLDAWYTLAHEACAMIHVAAALYTEKSAKRGYWHMLVYRRWCGAEGGEPSLDMLNQPRHAVSARAFLEDSVCQWLAWGAVQPRFVWPANKDPMIEFDGYGLFGALAAQLLGTLSRRGWAVCTECRHSYDPVRRPNRNRRNFCPECGAKGKASVYSSRDERERRAKVKEKGR
jgi:hypothetical protein